MKSSGHLTYMQSLKMHSSYMVAYPQRGPGAGRREGHTQNQNGWKGAKKMLPGMQQAREAPLLAQEYCGVCQTISGSARWHGPGAHLLCFHSGLNCWLCSGQKSIWGSQARYLPFPMPASPACCVWATPRSIATCTPGCPCYLNWGQVRASLPIPCWVIRQGQ